MIIFILLIALIVFWIAKLISGLTNYIFISPNDNPPENIEESTVTINEPTKVFEFRPTTWEEFIGQEKAKKRANILIKKAHKGIKAHLLLDGLRGHGKTSFVYVLAKYLNAKVIEYIGKQIDEENIQEIVNEINESEEKYVILFIDEFDSMDKKAIKMLNPIIEQFKFNGHFIRPFIFAGATINKHELLKNNPDTLDRIPTHIKLERYNSEEIARIIKQYKEQLYSKENVSEETINKIATNSKFNPRTSIALLEDYIVEQDINEILNTWGIIKYGLTDIDYKLLDTLSKATRPMGINALAVKSKLSPKEYVSEYENYLIEQEYIDRVPSRIITEKGKEILEELKIILVNGYIRKEKIFNRFGF